MEKVNELIKRLEKLNISDTERIELIRFIEYEVLEEDKQNLNEIKRMIYNNMMAAKESNNTKDYRYWYEEYQKLKEDHS